MAKAKAKRVTKHSLSVEAVAKRKAISHKGATEYVISVGLGRLAALWRYEPDSGKSPRMQVQGAPEIRSKIKPKAKPKDKPSAAPAAGGGK